MSETATETADQLPGGMYIPEGESPDEAAEGLFEALGSDPEFEEPDEGEQSTDESDEELEDVGSEDEDFEEADEADEEDEFEDESDEDGDEADGDAPELSDDTVIEGVPLPGGETTEVTLAELKAGYSRTQDYTQKRQRDAAEHAEAMSELSEVRGQYKTHLEKLQELMSSAGPEKPSEALRKSNPGEWSAQMAEWQAYQDTLAKIGTAREGVEAEISQEQLQARQDYLAQQWETVLNEIPSWQDEATRTREMAELRQYAIEERGFTAEEADSLADARLLLMLKENYDLRQQRDSAQKTVEKKKGKAKDRLGPGSRKRGGKRQKSRKRQQSADERLQTTGSIKDAAASIELLLGDDD